MPNLIDRILAPAFDRYLEQFKTSSQGAYSTNAGLAVGVSSMFELVAVRAAINVLSQDVATLPLKMYRSEGKRRVEVNDHPLAVVLNHTPNPRMTPYEMRENMMVALMTWGNYYGYVVKDNRGRTSAVYPIRPDRTSVTLDENGALVYTYTPANDSLPIYEFTQGEILHVRGMSSDGIVGRSPLADFREKIGEIAATERMTQSFYGNGMKKSAVLKHQGTLTDGAFARLQKSMEEQSGVSKAYKVLILEEGMDFSELTFAPEDAQLLDTRRFSVEDVCRIYNLPAYKLRINTPGTVSYASVDAQHIDYLVSSLTPWLVRIEQAFMRCCLTPAESADGYFVEHNTRALLRSDLKSQAEALKIGREASWYSVNDCRDHLGENPVDDPRADDPFIPVNFTGYTGASDAPGTITA